MSYTQISSTLLGKADYSDSAFGQTQGVANEAIIAVADDRVTGNLKER